MLNIPLTSIKPLITKDQENDKAAYKALEEVKEQDKKLKELYAKKGRPKPDITA